MEERYAREAERRGAEVDQMILLGIEDDYLYGADALKALLRERFAAALADPDDWRAQSV
ncbi:hypothetical protein [Parvularcula dongshanensis]|uniref:Uncharacterized protein n=1 Tax=Parvularcula dongshanensis TaxID=1173995 RepID=A0A840I794_9PROT|nr:hypothetical protein [Parvularcula dongshanensis]MBB4660195.1 hypothetical protein [Parvularcula dongshanensis]